MKELEIYTDNTPELRERFRYVGVLFGHNRDLNWGACTRHYIFAYSYTGGMTQGYDQGGKGYVIGDEFFRAVCEWYGVTPPKQPPIIGQMYYVNDCSQDDRTELEEYIREFRGMLDNKMIFKTATGDYNSWQFYRPVPEEITLTLEEIAVMAGRPGAKVFIKEVLK